LLSEGVVNDVDSVVAIHLQQKLTKLSNATLTGLQNGIEIGNETSIPKSTY
jgi:hypothetical protein